MIEWIKRLRNRIENFLFGRYGMDVLSRDLYILSFVLLLLGLVFRSGPLHFVLQLAGEAIIFVCLWRILSKNIYARQLENAKYLSLRGKVIEKYLSIERKAAPKVRAFKEKADPKIRAFREKAGPKFRSFKEKALSKFRSFREMAGPKFLALRRRVKDGALLLQRRWKERKVSLFYYCPSCRQLIRVPRHRGKIEIRCPKCGQSFVKNTGKRKGIEWDEVKKPQ